jgi:integrase
LNTKNGTLNPIINVCLELENNGKPETTIKALYDQLLHLQRNTDLNNPEAVKDYIAHKPNASASYKQKLVWAYDKYAQHYKIQWTRPIYKRLEKMPKLPSTKQIDALISGAGKTLSLKLWMIKETGARPCELHDLKVKDFDTEHSIINLTTHKNGIARSIQIPLNLKQALQAYITNNRLQPNVKIFRSNSRHFGDDYRQMRNTLAKKLNQPELTTVRLYDFRHYFATMRYWKLRDIPLTAQDMGHRDYNTTRKYLHLCRILELMTEDGYISKTSRTLKEDQELIDAGFEYVTERDGTKIYRKRK